MRFNNRQSATVKKTRLLESVAFKSVQGQRIMSDQEKEARLNESIRMSMIQ